MSAELPKPHGYLFERCEFMYPDMLDQEVIDDPTTFAVYTADQMREYAQEAARQAMEQFERQVSEWMHVPTLKLRAGEMTAQEVRTVIGVLGAIRAIIPHDPDHLAGVGNMVDGKDQSEKRHG